MESRITRRDLVWAVALAVAALVLFVQTSAPTVLAGDSGEFQFAAPLLGLAHPTGYPLYLLLGKLWTALVPWGDAARRMNLLSALLAALSVGAFYLFARQLRLSPAAAVLAALTLAVSQTFWSQAVRAEVYALNSLLVIVLLALAVAVGSEDVSALHFARRRTSVGPYLLFFVLGLALAHHRTSLLLIPALLVLAWPGLLPPAGVRRSGSRARTLAGYLAALAAPMLLYAYIPLRAPATPYLQLPVGGGPELVLYDNTVTALLTHVTGSVFRGSVDLAMQPVQRLAMVGELHIAQVGWAGLVLALTGCVALFLGHRRIALGLLLAYLAVAAFCLVYFIGDIADLFTPAYVVVCIWAGFGIETAAGLGERLLKKPGRVAVFVLALLLPVSLYVTGRPANDLSNQTTTRAAWEDLLGKPIAQDAILVSNDRDEMTPMWYLQHVEGVRPDLVGLFPKVSADERLQTLGGLLDWLLERGQQPYLIKPMPGLDVKYHLETSGPLTQVTGNAAASPVQPQRPSGASLDGKVQLTGADGPASITPGETLTVTLYWAPQAPMGEDYHAYVHLENAAGERVAGSDQRPGGAYYPTSAWQPGDNLVDVHAVEIPAVLPAGTYRLKAGMYAYPSLALLPVAGSMVTSVDLGPVDIP